MHAILLLWMVDSLRTATRALPAPLLIVSRKLRQAFTMPKRGHIPARVPRAPRSASTYTMLVESDVQHGMRGILP